MVLAKPRASERYQYVAPYLLTKFMVDGEPVPKARPRLGIRGQTYTPKSTVQAEAHIKECCFVNDPRLYPHRGLMQLKVRFFMGRRGRADLDNLWKLVADALNGIAWHDDAQVVKTEAEIVQFAEFPHTDVEVYLIAVPEK